MEVIMVERLAGLSINQHLLARGSAAGG